jgi:hypothetical protein
MKKKFFLHKKLSLNKEIVGILNKDQQSRLAGGLAAGSIVDCLPTIGGRCITVRGCISGEPRLSACIICTTG